ncbi:MAG: hypothetical protein WBO24_20905, partial [Nitrospirales bacterium]
CYNTTMKKTGFVERRGKLEDLDRSFDLAFWQSQSPAARMDAAWELAVHAAKLNGQDVTQLRLDRTVEVFGKQER